MEILDKHKNIKYNILDEGIKDDILIKDMTGYAVDGYLLSDQRFMALSSECVAYGNTHLEALLNLYETHGS